MYEEWVCIYIGKKIRVEHSCYSYSLYCIYQLNIYHVKPQNVIKLLP